VSILPPPVVLVLPAALLGLVMGSFATALSYRQPRAQSVSRGRSKCPSCAHTLGVADLVPVVSWLAQRGRCRYCKTSISWRYPAIEFATMALFIAGAVLMGDVFHLALLGVMSVVMMTLAVIDLEQQRLPNGFLLILLALSLAWRWEGDHDIVQGLVTALIVFAMGVMLNAAFQAVAARPGLGMGDTKLVAILAIGLPLGPFLLTLTAAGVLGIGFGLIWLWRSGVRQFPFGPVILAAYWTGLTVGPAAFDHLVSWLR
jgi:leader peptidase (prepilin peptidase)/N-methyltransferase